MTERQTRKSIVIMYATVVLARRLPGPLTFLTYLVPEQLAAAITLHQLVAVPFSKSTQYGLVTALNEPPPTQLKKDQALKTIKEIINREPILSGVQFTFVEEISTLYHTPLGWLLKNTLFPLQPRKIKTFGNTITSIPRLGGVGVGEDAQEAYARSTVLSLSKLAPRTQLFQHSNETDKITYLTEQLAAGTGQQLILVPEVKQLESIKKSLPPTLADKTIIIDSTTKPKPYFEAWLRLWQGEPLIIIGTRSALFLPWQNLQAIFVLDESNPSYKSFDAAPRLETRDAARFLAWQHHAALHLLSALPSLESYYFSQQKLYESNIDGTRNKEQGTRNLEIANLNDEYYSRNKSPLSEAAQTALSEVGNNEIGICFVNHRGSASFITCQDCQFIWKCPTCQHNLIWHEQTKNLRCHYCKTNQSLPSTCPNCHGTLIKLGGIGTEKIEGLLRPLATETNATIIRIDKDHEGAIPQTNQPLYIVTTTAGWSEIPWERVKVVVFVDPDTLLFIPEYKITERLWYYIQMSRYYAPPTARILVQTRRPEQALFQDLNNPETWYTEELKQRRRFKYPPYWFLLKIGFRHADRLTAARAANQLYERLKTLTHTTEDAIVLPPVPSFPERSKGSFNQIIIIKIKLTTYKKTTKRLLAEVPDNWKVDLNPQDLLGAI